MADWRKESYVWEHLIASGAADQAPVASETLVEGFEEAGIKEPKAWVVSVGWLFMHLVKCIQKDQETMRILIDAKGDLYIEGHPIAAPPDVGTWNNDWPKIGFP